MASYYPDTPKPMQFCAAMVAGMPVYESTGIETKEALRREAWTQLLCDLVGEIYMGCYSIGEPFKISSLKLLNLSADIALKHERAISLWQKRFPTTDPWTLVAWIDRLLDSHEGQREIEFKWM